MRNKKTFAPVHVTSILYREVSKFCKSWPAKQDLVATGIELAGEYFTPGGNSLVVVNSLISAASRPKNSPDDIRETFADTYISAPDFTLAIMTHLRHAISKWPAARRYFMEHGLNLEDDKTIACAIKVSIDVVKTERAKLREEYAKFSKFLDGAEAKIKAAK
jgi:hypothetical protein